MRYVNSNRCISGTAEVENLSARVRRHCLRHRPLLCKQSAPGNVIGQGVWTAMGPWRVLRLALRLAFPDIVAHVLPPGVKETVGCG